MRPIIPTKARYFYLHIRIITSTTLGLLVAAANNFVTTSVAVSLLPARFVWIPGALVAGLVAGALQGALLHSLIRNPYWWLSMSCIGWLSIGIVDGIALPVSLNQWACTDAARWALIGGINSILVAGLQSLAVRQRADVLFSWLVWNAIVWAYLWALPFILFGQLLFGEGMCPV